MRSRCAVALLAVIATLAAAGWPAVGQTPKRGGILNAMLMEDPPGFSIHESSTISGVWPVAPCYSNLVTFDSLKPVESVETVIAELAERWSWQDSYRNLVLFLRKNVKWHDGKSFSSADVKYTFDVVREAKDAPAKLRLSPRKDWYANVEAIEAPDAHTVIFRLKRPQPSLIYLDGIRYPIITERGTRLAALQTGRLDTGIPLEMTKLMAETIKKNVPSMIVTEIGQNGSDNVVMNHKKPPFDNVVIRRAVSLAMDRHAYVKGVRYNGAVVGAALMPKPWGSWGLLDKDLQALPGYRDPAVDKAEAKRLLAQAGAGPAKPLRLELTTRAIAIYVDLASFVADQLRQVGVEAAVKQLDTAQYFPALARREFVIGANLTAGAFDDPDAYLFENYKCGTARNYTDYCNEAMDRLIDEQSEELDRDKRLKRVWEIQRKLEADVARPMLGWRTEYFTRWPYVKNLVPHNSLYNYARMQEVWLDR
ncbi:MAG: hypothetical protein AUG80_06015 [Candidatus Rokubacteria bacterium 13_1_20CM_4_68_9]|nr:MAG: hypothetical protein AUG80_06015 [Candidatus Rokubacteria bacterium 13_1_20CM_4_68_9]